MPDFEGINNQNIKQEFFNTLGDEKSLNHYRKAYIILLLKAFFELSNNQGQADFNEIANYFKQFYLDRKKKGFQIENNPDSRIENIEESKISDIKYIIKGNPLNTKTLENYLSLQENKVVMNNVLWNQLDRDELYQIRYIVNKQLSKYFNERVDGDSMSIPNVSKDEIEQALHNFDSELRNTDRWKNFVDKKNHKYVIKFNNKLYPVKQIISMATGAHVSTFSGGDEANSYIKNKGFDIIELDKSYSNFLKQKFEYIMDSYLEAREHQKFTGHELGDLFRHELPQIINNYLSDFKDIESNNYSVKGSIGQGNWARVPWIAILDKKITSTTQEGVYVVYLFSKDMNRLYLTLNQGVTNSTKEELITTRDNLRSEMKLPFSIDNNINLAARGIGSDYELSTIGYIEYKKGSIPDEEKLINDLKNVMNVYNKYKIKYMEGKKIEDNSKTLSVKDKVEYIADYISNSGFTYPNEMIKNFYLSLKIKPFVLLAGISGTGKTKLVQLFAEAIGCNSDNKQFKLISVKPDWNDSSDLLGYSNIRGDFQAGPIIKIIKSAIENPDKPYIVCLDEMNLARVEYYFSEFLSKMETRRFKDGKIITDKLLTKDDFDQRDENASEKYAGLYIPQNLYIVGTVNMDETTHPFSKKVLDRANTIEFNEIELKAYQENNYNQSDLETISVNNEFLVTEHLNLKETLDENEELVNDITTRLSEINDILKEANLQVGYRIRDEINFFTIEALKNDILDIDTAFDKQLMQKVLPRIQGSSRRIKNILVKLYKYTSDKDYTKENGDLGQDMLDYYNNNKENIKYPSSSEKISYMVKRYEEDGFTAYWL